MIKQLLWPFILLLCACGKPAPQPEAGQTPERIISLAPNITETLYDLGLGKQLIGATRFSSTETNSDLPIVGDFMNINYEKIVSLQPDLVILEKSADAEKARLAALGIPYLETGSLSIDAIVESIQRIGTACGAEAQASTLVEAFTGKMESLRNTPSHRPRTLITFSDYSNHDKIEQVYAFGADCIHSELLDIAGGDNVVSDSRPSVILSREAVIRMNPELIIELAAGGPSNNWENLPSVDAVQHHRIHVLDGTYTTIPAPTCLLKTLEDISTIIRKTDLSQ